MQILYAIDTETGQVLSRKGEQILIPILDVDAMTFENGFETRYNLEKFDLIGIDRYHLLKEWNKPTMFHTKKIPIVLKNRHRKIWDVKLLKDEMNEKE